jgi:hypothetical protein
MSTSIRPKRWVFHTTCVDSDGPSINAMNASAVPLSYATLRKHLGSALVEVEERLNYDVGRARPRNSLRMKNDWAVSYWRSTYQGKPCFFFRWSMIEHIFLEA